MPRYLGATLALAPILLMLSSPLAGQATEVRLASGFPFSAGEVANGESKPYAQTPDGRFLVFQTEANNLVGDVLDGNLARDIYVLDRQDGSFDLVTRDAARPGRAAFEPQNNTTITGTTAGLISDDGRFVAYQSNLHNLIAGGTYPPGFLTSQVYLFDRTTRTAALVSHVPGDATAAGNADSDLDALSADGRFAIFTSSATSLAGGLGPSTANVYLHDRSTGANRLVSRSAANPLARADGNSAGVAVSPDGRFVLFSSRATDLVAGQSDTANSTDAFVYDRQSDTVELISRSAGSPATAAGGQPVAISADGRYVLLDSPTLALGTGLTDENGSATDVFLFDRQSGLARLVSAAAADPTHGGNLGSNGYALSTDGQTVYLASQAATLVSPFTENNSSSQADLFLFEAGSGVVKLVSHIAGNANATGHGHLTESRGFSSVSRDGRWATYFSTAGDLDASASDGNGATDVYRYDRLAGTSTLVSRIGASNVAGGLGLTGRVLPDDSGAVVFPGRTPLDAAPNPWSQAAVWRFDAGTSAVSLVSKAGVAGETTLPSSTNYYHGSALSPDGRFVLWGAYLWDSRTGRSELIGHAAGSPGTPAAGAVGVGGLSADGRFVLLTSGAPDTAAGIADGNGSGFDVYLYDRNVDTAFLMSRALGESNRSANGSSAGQWLSADAGKMVLSSYAGDLQTNAPPGAENLYLLDRATGACRLLSHAPEAPLVRADRDAYVYAAGANAGWVVHGSIASNLVTGFVDHNDYWDANDDMWIRYPDLYYYDVALGKTTLITRRPGTSNDGTEGICYPPKVSADGSSVFFTGTADDLVAGQIPSPQADKVYRWDRASNSVTLVSHQPGNPNQACGSAFLKAIAPNGRWILFDTTCAYNPGDTDFSDVYLLDRQTGTFSLISHAPGNPNLAEGGWAVAVSDDGRRVTYTKTRAAYSYDRLTGKRTLLSYPYDDPSHAEAAIGDVAQATGDGNYVLLSTNSAVLTPFDGNDLDDQYLVTLGDLFADGFETGTTAGWSQTLP